MKYILIIGAKNELALELASLYAKNNYNIYLAGRSINDLEEESNNIEQKYKVKSVLCELDVTNFSSHEDFYESLEIKPTGVIYLAGYYPDMISSISKWSESLKTIEVNYLGCVSSGKDFFFQWTRIPISRAIWGIFLNGDSGIREF